MSAGVRSFPGIRRLLPAAVAQRARAVSGTEGALASASLAARLVAAAACCLALTALLACGWFTRYSSHAFQTADLLRDHGFIGGQVAWYQGWTGRFGATAAWLAAVAPGPWFTRVAPTLALVSWGAALWMALPRVAATMGRRLTGVSRLLAVAVVLLATLSTAPALWFNLYKLTGSVTYIAPMALGTTALGLALGALHAGETGARRMVPLAVVSGLAVGFSDTYAGVQPIVVAFLAVCAAFVPGRRRTVALRAGVVVAASTVAGLAVLLVAPGNQVRRSFYPPPPHLTTAVGRSVADAWGFVSGPLAHALPVLAGVIVAFLVVGWTAGSGGEAAHRPGLTLRRGGLALLALVAVVVGSHLPAEQMTSAPPPPRSEIIPTYATVLGIAFLAWSAGVTLRARHAASDRRPPRGAARLGLAAATVAMLVAPAMTMTYVARSWQAMSAYAAAKDLQWQEAANATPGSDVVLDPVPTTDVGPLSHDPMQEVQPSATYWVNQSVAEYFGLHSVRAPRQGH